jgi:hypothetical protein
MTLSDPPSRRPEVLGHPARGCERGEARGGLEEGPEGSVWSLPRVVAGCQVRSGSVEGTV